MATNVKRERQEDLTRAIAILGGASATAKALGLTKQAVWWWYRCPDVPLVAMEELTGIPGRELRPDLYPKVEKNPSTDGVAKLLQARVRRSRKRGRLTMRCRRTASRSGLCLWLS